MAEAGQRPLGMCAKALHVPVNRITATSALRLARFFGTTSELWTNLQGARVLDLGCSAHGAKVETEVSKRVWKRRACRFGRTAVGVCDDG